MRPERDEDHPSPCITDVKNAWSCTSIPLISLSTSCRRKNFTYFYFTGQYIKIPSFQKQTPSMLQPCSGHLQINYQEKSCSSFHRNPHPSPSITTFNGLARGLTASANRLIGLAVIDDSVSPLNSDIRATFSSEGISFNYSVGWQLVSTCTEMYPLQTVGRSVFMYRVESPAILCCNKTKFRSPHWNLCINLFLIRRER